MIPLVKVGLPDRNILMPAIEEVLYSGMIAEGEYVYRFEEAFQQRFELNNVLAVNSGTAALHLALILSGIKNGDEVITTSMTAEPTNTSILQAGATPVFADVDPETGNLSVDSVKALITPKTKAICVVHYAGYPAPLKDLRVIADNYGLSLIEDCAHALGAQSDGKPVGTIGDYSIFSFQAIKHMTTIDGGVLVIKDSEKLGLAKRLRWFGLAKGVPRTEVDITTPGYKYNMNNVTAAIGLKQLEFITPLLQQHFENGQYYDHVLINVNGLASAKVESGDKSAYWLYTLLSDDSDDVEKLLVSNGITASKLHRPNHFHSIFKAYTSSLPGLDKFYQKLVHIPCGWWVSKEDRERIVEILKRG